MRPNRIGCVALAVAAGVTSVAAQSAPAALGPRRFGIAGGANSSTIAGGDIGEPSRRTSPIAGLLLVAPVSDMIAIEPEVLFTSKGANFKEPSGDGSLKISYVEIPLLLRVEAIRPGGMRPFVFAGPALAIKASCDLTSVEGGVDTSISCDELFSGASNFKSVDYSVLVGAGLAFDLGGKMFSVGARYDHSLGEVLENSKIKHRVISILATLEFPWAK